MLLAFFWCLVLVLIDSEPALCLTVNSQLALHVDCYCIRIDDASADSAPARHADWLARSLDFRARLCCCPRSFVCEPWTMDGQKLMLCTIVNQ